MKILYIGYLLKEEDYKFNPASNVSGGIFEEGLLYELDQINKNSLTILTLTPNDYYPKSVFFSHCVEEITNRGLHYKTIHYVNLPIVKHIFAYISLVIEIRKWIQKNKDERKVILYYNLGTPIVQAADLFRRSVDGIYSIICDFFVPQTRPHGLIGLLKMKTINAQSKYLKRNTGAVILNKNLADDYKLKNYIILEGAVSVGMEGVHSEIESMHNPIRVRYAGALDELHGCKVLIEIGELLKERNIEIDFSVAGRGNMDDTIKIASDDENNALKYVGQLSRDSVNTFIKESDILLIPHQTRFKQLRYQFSSKMFDYMASGKSVVVTPMPGFPDEYKDYVYVSKDDSASAIVSEIIKIVDHNAPDIRKHNKKAQEFAIHNRTWKAQTVRLYDFVAKK